MGLKLFAALSLLLLASGWPALGADPALKESVPEAVTPKPEQREVVEALARHVTRCDAIYNEQGEVEVLLLCNHQAFRRIEDENRTGVTDEAFGKLHRLNSLKGLHLLKQPLSDDAFQVLKDLQHLEAFCVEGHTGDDTGRFMLQINGHPQLQWLELKHLFGLDGSKVNELETFPKLVRLELDNASATAQALPFLKRNASVRDFELHRSTMTNDEIGEMVSLLPSLERLALKPGGGKCFDHRCLAHVNRLDHLRILGFHHWKEPMFVWEDGLEHLVSMPALEGVECGENEWELPAMQELRRARPELKRLIGNNVVARFGYEPQR